MLPCACPDTLETLLGSDDGATGSCGDRRRRTTQDFEFRNEDTDLAIFRRPYYDERILRA